MGARHAAQERRTIARLERRTRTRIPLCPDADPRVPGQIIDATTCQLLGSFRLHG
jgi:hypothetical protein